MAGRLHKAPGGIILYAKTLLFGNHSDAGVLLISYHIVYQRFNRFQLLIVQLLQPVKYAVKP